LGCPEVVRVCVSIGNGTLRHAVESVGFIRVKLANAVPMDCTSISREIVGHMNGEIIAQQTPIKGLGYVLLETLPSHLRYPSGEIVWSVTLSQYSR